MGFKELWFLTKKYFLWGFIVSMSPITTLGVQNAIRITWAKEGECWWTFSTGEYIFNLKH